MIYFERIFTAWFVMDTLVNPQGVAATPEATIEQFTWDTSFHTPHIDISPDGLTASTTDANDWGRGRANQFPVEEKVYFEMKAIYAPYSAADGSMFLYLATGDWDATDAVSGPGPAFDADKVLQYNPAGDIYTGQTWINEGDSRPWVSGENTRWAIDNAAGKGWVGNAAGWYGDPEAGTGEAFTFTPGTQWYPAFLMYSNGADTTSVEIVAKEDLAYAVPTGFTAAD